jgi:DNA-binding response OmpR family regulator
MAETRDAVRARMPDLLLLDRMFPEGDGCLLCQEFKANPATQAIPIIMLTARDRVEDRVEGLLQGADDYIPKPFHPEFWLCIAASEPSPAAEVKQAENCTQAPDLLKPRNA